MIFSEPQLQFFQVLNRLKKLDWGKLFSVLKPPEYLALHTINCYHQEHPDTPGIYVSDFAASLCIAVPAASKLLKAMEKQGWLTRMVDPNNRRNTFIVLTPEGASILESEQEYCAIVGSRVLNRLGQENTAQLLTGVNRILDIIEEEFRAESC